MEGIADDEDQLKQLKSSESLKEEILEEEAAISPDTIPQGQSQVPEDSALDEAPVNKSDADIGSGVKSKHSYQSGKSEVQTNASVTEENPTNLQSIESLTQESFKDDLKVDEPAKNEIKNKRSNYSDSPKVISDNISNQMNIYSTSVHSTVRIKISSSNTSDSSVQTQDDEQSMKEKYLEFPKSVPSSVNVNPNVINVRFDCEDVSFASAFEISTTMGEIKKRLYYILELEEDSIIFQSNGEETKDSQTLADLGGQPHGKVTLNVISKSGEQGNALMRLKIEENLPTINVITVHLNEGDVIRDVTVQIENESIQKQWFGGFRNKQRGTEYHNAMTQTFKKKEIFKIDEATGEKIPLVYNRDTQTPFPLVQKTVNTVVDKATQMSKSDLFVTSQNDKIISSQVQKKRRKLALDMHLTPYVIKIQRAVRGWIKRKRFVEVIHLQIELLRKFKEDQQKIIQDQEGKDRAVISGAAFPVHRDDFYALFLRVEKWWKKEWKNICENKRSESKKAASLLLIDKETTLLRAIEKHKAASKEESLKKKEMRFLERISRPTLFRTSSGLLTTIDCLDTQKAREFKEIYSALVIKDASPKDRIETLLTVKKLFESHYMAYEYAADLVSLVNREIELIGIGFKSEELKALQSRIELLFLNFLHQPEFNPAAKKYKEPNLPKTTNQTYRCTRCWKLLPASKYPAHVRMKAFTECTSCTWMQNIAHKRADLSPYIKLLHQVQNSEMQKCCYSAICFILQPIGMSFLTNVIWHGRSAISECPNIQILHHVRWLPDVEWAPWNTILLTDQEAKLHESIPDIFSFYDEQFIEKVRQKHILARKDFIPLLIMDHDIRQTGMWSKITDSGVFLHSSHAERIASENPDYDTL